MKKSKIPKKLKNAKGITLSNGVTILFDTTQEFLEALPGIEMWLEVAGSTS